MVNFGGISVCECHNAEPTPVHLKISWYRRLVGKKGGFAVFWAVFGCSLLVGA
jgi:hypothetical protein